MGRKCCVTNCNSDYKSTKVFRLPSEKREPDERSRWIKAIPRDNIPDHKNTSICEDHWPSGYETISRYGKLRPLYAPSVFKNIKASLVPTPPAPARVTSRSLNSVRNIIPDEIDLFNERDKIKSFADIFENLNYLDCNWQWR